MFGSRLKELRSENNMTQQDLAALLKVSASTVGMYEQGRRDPDTDTVKFLAKYFSVSTDWLLGLSYDRIFLDEASVEKKHGIETKAYHNLDKSGLPEEAIKQIDDYIEFIKQKYNPDGTL